MLTLSDIQSLLHHTDEPTLSLYLNTDAALAENQASIPAWRITTKNLLNNLKKTVNDDQYSLLAELRQRIDQYLEHYLPAGRGLALFFRASLDQAYELPLAVEPQAAFGQPLITPLLALITEHQVSLLVMVDHAQARFFTIVGGQIQLQDTMDLKLDTSDWRTKTAMPSSVGLGHGNATDEFDERVVEEMTRQFQKVAVRLGHLMQQHHGHWIVLTGDEQSTHTVRNLLPSYLKDVVVAVMPLPMRYSAAEVLRNVQPVLVEHTENNDLQRVEQVIDTARARGRAALGLVAVQHALERGRIQELIVPATAIHDAQLQDLMLNFVSAGTPVEFVHGAAAKLLAADGGIAARLYYAA